MEIKLSSGKLLRSDHRQCRLLRSSRIYDIVRENESVEVAYHKSSYSLVVIDIADTSDTKLQ